jgi:chaperonin cofactor prefoldin
MEVDAQKIQELHSIELELSQINEEKRSLERQKVECEAAVQELATAPVAYKIIGAIMISTKPADLLNETKERLAAIDVQLTNLKKREDGLIQAHTTLASK